MADAFLIWGGDLAIGPTGDVALAKASKLDEQRILRRLLTNRGDYIWQPDYGAGLAAFVGMPAKKLTIEAIILEQMTLEPSVATMPPAAITVSAAASGLVNADIKYVDSQTGSQRLLSFSVGT